MTLVQFIPVRRSRVDLEGKIMRYFASFDNQVYRKKNNGCGEGLGDSEV